MRRKCILSMRQVFNVLKNAFGKEKCCRSMIIITLACFCLLFPVNIVLADEVLVSQEDYNDFGMYVWGGAVGDADCIAQMWKATDNQIDVTGISIYVTSTDSDGYGVAGISTTNTTNPNQWLDFETMALDKMDGWKYFDVDSSVTGGNSYWVLFTVLAYEKKATVQGSTDNPYPDGILWFYDNSEEIWIDYANRDMAFRIYGNEEVENYPPIEPYISSGPHEGCLNAQYMYRINAWDPDEDEQLEYRIDWDGGGWDTDWIDFTNKYNDNGYTKAYADVGHTWTSNFNGNIRVQSRDDDEEESPIYDGYAINMYNHDPELPEGYIDPTGGDHDTSFNFSAKYADGDGDPPGSKTVYYGITGGGQTSHEMTAGEGSYVEGKWYHYSSIIGQELNVYDGDGWYYFYFDDGNGHSVRKPTTETYSFIISSENIQPIAYIDNITPNPAKKGELVCFSGHGYDHDGDITDYNLRSSIDGQLSTSEPPLLLPDLSAGAHTLYFKVQDDEGAWSEEVSEVLNISFYFVHITDPHVFGHNLFPHDERWEDVISQIRSWNPQPEFVLCSGDLVDFGSGEPISYAALKYPLYKNGDTYYIEGSNIPIYFCPGNHDAYNRPFTIPYNFATYYSQVGPDYYSIIDENCVIFSMNSGQNTWEDEWWDLFKPEGDGLDNKYCNPNPEVDQMIADLDNLDGVQNERDDSSYFKIFITHHPYRRWGDSKDMVFWWNRDTFINACENYSIDALFSGHIHFSDITCNKYGSRWKEGDGTNFVVTPAIAEDLEYRNITVAPSEYLKVGGVEAFNDTITAGGGCNALCHCYDSEDNHNGPDETGVFEREIPYSTCVHEVFSNESMGINKTYTVTSVYRKNDEDYSFVFESLSNDTMNITVRVNLKKGFNSTATYENVTMYEGSNATLYANNSIVNYTLQIKDPGGGTREENPSTYEGNLPPETPGKPSGPSQGWPLVKQWFSANATEPDYGDQLYYMFDWGDGDYSNWLGPYNSGETVSRWHRYSKEEYYVRVKAKDSYGVESEWSEPAKITIKWLGPPGGGCFLAGASITMANGSYKNIEDIEVGDIVKSYNVTTSEIVNVTVTAVYNHTSDEMPDYYLVINNKIDVTPIHIVFINDTLMRAEFAKVGDVIVGIDGENTTIDSIDMVFEKVPTYNFEYIPTSYLYIAYDMGAYPLKVKINKPAKPSGEYSVDKGVNYSYSTSTTDIAGGQLFYRFDWGDGTDSGWIGPINSRETLNASHMWTEKGNYEIKVDAKDIYGEVSNWSDTLAIATPVEAFLAMNPSEFSTANEIIYFNDNSFPGYYGIVNWTWDFDDGNISYEQNTSHEYAVDGVYNVTLTVTDNQSNTANSSQTIYIDSDAPEVSNIFSNPDTVGFGFNVTTSADVTDITSGVSIVNVSVVYPDESSKNSTMNYITGDTYEYVFSDTWLVGQYNYTIWAVDNAGNGNISSGHSFNVSAQANISVCTLKDEYGSNEYINITDPPEGAGGDSEEPQIGYELMDNNTVLHVWNRYNSYYFNTSSGIHLTNHYNEYWSHNVLMLGYYDGDEWNLIYRTDELSGFNKNIDGDNETYINATLWKDLSYGDYDFRLAIRYHLGVNDSDLTIIPYIKNLGIAIPYVLGFGWELKDIQINAAPELDYINVNKTSYHLNQTLNNTYTNLSFPLYNESGNITGWTNPIFEICENITNTTSKYLYLTWDRNLTYKVTVENRAGHYNAPTTLFIKVGTLGVGQEKFTEMHWLDADTVTYYWSNYESSDWDYPECMVNGDEEEYAETQEYAAEQMNSDNTCPADDLGTIAKVEIRVKSAAYEANIMKLQPRFSLGEDWGDEHEWWTITSETWSEWLDVTEDTNASESWTWEDVDTMFLLIIAGETEGIYYYCSKIEVRVTYTPSGPPPNTAPTQSNHKIWNATTKVEKSLNATAVGLYPTSFNITINDLDGDKMNITIKTNESGDWTIVNQTYGSGLSNGTYSFTNTSWIDSYNTVYYISFKLTDGPNWTNETYHFTTESETVYTSVDTISPYNQTSFPLTITAYGSSDLDNVTLWYRYSTDNSTWSKRKPVYFNVSSGETEENYTVLLNITYDSDMQNDFDDLCFVRYSDNTTELDYWIESKSDGKWALVWVEIADNITTTNKTLAWMYYGNSGASSKSNGSATFVDFKDYTSDPSIGGDTFPSPSYFSYNDGTAKYYNRRYGGPKQRWYRHCSINSHSTDQGYLRIKDFRLDTISVGHGMYGAYGWFYIGNQTNDFIPSLGFRVSYDTDYGNTDATHSAIQAVSYNDTAGVVTSWDDATLTEGNTYDIEVYISGTTLYLKIDGAVESSVDVSSLGLGTGHPLQYDYFVNSIYTYNDNLDNRITGWLDNELIRKYISPEPTYSIGNEQGSGSDWMAWSNSSNPDTSIPWSWEFDFPNGVGYYEFYSIGKKSGQADESAYDSADAWCCYWKQSKINNTGTTDIKGYLLMQVHYFNETLHQWVVADDTVNETSPRIINASDQFGLDTIFNGLVNTQDLSEYGSGTYRVYAALRDPDENILKCDDESELEAWYEFNITFE